MQIRETPNADGADVFGAATGDSTRTLCVDDVYGSEDDDTTYIRFSGGNVRGGFTVPGGHAPKYRSVTSVTAEARARHEAAVDPRRDVDALCRMVWVCGDGGRDDRPHEHRRGGRCRKEPPSHSTPPD